MERTQTEWSLPVLLQDTRDAFWTLVVCDPESRTASLFYTLPDARRAFADWIAACTRAFAADDLAMGAWLNALWHLFSHFANTFSPPDWRILKGLFKRSAAARTHSKVWLAPDERETLAGIESTDDGADWPLQGSEQARSTELLRGIFCNSGRVALLLFGVAPWHAANLLNAYCEAQDSVSSSNTNPIPFPDGGRFCAGLLALPLPGLMTFPLCDSRPTCMFQILPTGRITFVWTNSGQVLVPAASLPCLVDDNLFCAGWNWRSRPLFWRYQGTLWDVAMVESLALRLDSPHHFVVASDPTPHPLSPDTAMPETAPQC